MTDTTQKLEQLLQDGLAYISQASVVDLTSKPSPEKWSKKEILGHLIDSAIHNMQRFTEIQFENKPYKIRKYNQNALVKVNDYQNADVHGIVQFWLAINKHIKHLILAQSETTLKYKIEIDKDTSADLRFLMKDYVSHLEHHLNQIIAS